MGAIESLSARGSVQIRSSLFQREALCGYDRVSFGERLCTDMIESLSVRGSVWIRSEEKFFDVNVDFGLWLFSNSPGSPNVRVDRAARSARLFGLPIARPCVVYIGREKERENTERAERCRDEKDFAGHERTCGGRDGY